MNSHRDSITELCARHDAIAARYVINDDAVTRRRIKESMRGCALVAELNAMAWLLDEYGIRCRSSRQIAEDRFPDLPSVRSTAATYGVRLPSIVAFTDDEIDVGPQHTEDEVFDEFEPEWPPASQEELVE